MPKLVYYNPPSLCEKCGGVLHPVLIRSGHACHPCCDPGERPWRWRRRMLTVVRDQEGNPQGR